MLFRVCGMSLPGVKESNEDHFAIGLEMSQGTPIRLAVEGFHELAEQGLLAAVADGIGSYEGGALASATALRAMVKGFHTATTWTLEGRVRSGLKACSKSLNATLRKEKKKKAGTTLAGLALFPPDQLVIFHVGDSRVLRYRDGELRALTVDHTPVGEGLAFGKLSLEEALARKDAFTLTRSLGLWVDNRVEVQLRDFRPGDWFLMLTDGVCSPGRGLTEELITDYLRSGREPEQLLEPMLREATERDGDNATLILLHVQE